MKKQQTKSRVKLTPDQKEAKQIIKEMRNGKGELPEKGKNILDWTTKELNVYIQTQTAGLSNKEKMKFASDIIKMIKDEKELRGIKE